ncbi:hypothetical protein [Rhodoferax fermentans]|uniref:Uncharacterized protein n=1 Tax=Rhodoferax fermentans TaxID=28066 RepID=A0A1T1AX21_RHOFE|nr:hypothetical protein [Rhodoferax fermentans]MBK1682517.1 hypothetical protein [Rhodoferax fermentans]OOV08666.1 hypothetical protein RF819_19950 [Rhodoferax fermentans]
MSPTDSQLAAFKAIRQEAQSLMRTRLTSEVRDSLERILHITRVQINAGNAALQAQDNPAPAKPQGLQERLSQTPSEKRSRIIWVVVIALWVVVGYIGSQNIKQILQIPPETAQAAEADPAVEAPATAPPEAAAEPAQKTSK